MGTNAGPSSPTVDEATERNTALLRKCHENNVLLENRQACREYGIGPGKDELRKLQKFVSQAIIKLLNKYHITQSSGQPYVSSCPKGFLQGPDAWLSKKGYRISGWPRGLPNGSISIWPTPFTFSLALMFINGTIDLKPVGNYSHMAEERSNSTTIQEVPRKKLTESPELPTTGKPPTGQDSGAVHPLNSHDTKVITPLAIPTKDSTAPPESENWSSSVHELKNDQHRTDGTPAAWPEASSLSTPGYYSANETETSQIPRSVASLHPSLFYPGARERSNNSCHPLQPTFPNKDPSLPYESQAIVNPELRPASVIARGSPFSTPRYIGYPDWPQNDPATSAATCPKSGFSLLESSHLSDKGIKIPTYFKDSRILPPLEGLDNVNRNSSGRSDSFLPLAASLQMPDSVGFAHSYPANPTTQFIEPLGSSLTQNSLVHPGSQKMVHKRKEKESEYPGIPSGATINWIPPTSATRSGIKKRRKNYPL